MVRKEIVIEDGYRTEDVDGGIVTSMGIVESEKGGLRAFMDFDDGKGMATYNLTIKGSNAFSDDDKEKTKIPGYLDFSKINKSIQKQGHKTFLDEEAKTWETEPSIIGLPIWIKCVKTSTDKEGKEYKALIDVTKIGESQDKEIIKPSSAKGSPAMKGTLTPELLESWRDLVVKILTEPKEDGAIQQAVKKLIPDDEPRRRALAEVRPKALAALVKDGTLCIDEHSKYSIAV